MTPERWRQINNIFHSALALDPRERATFLSTACAGHDSLRREVESLIKHHERTGSFIDAPAYELAAEALIDEGTELPAGRQLGPYQIINTLGKGGMGHVYLAEDQRLGRRVALKLLPSHFGQNAERLKRFELEARATSSLNHPNILTIYEIGRVGEIEFIATEYIEGRTLREHIRLERMKVPEVLEVSVQIASALAAAHRAGVVHRDIKPENIMLRPDGIVKVLDFGLAKLMAEESAGPDARTRPMVQTSPGVVMGTAQYMSPEQARGLPVDARTDIFSFGSVLYEMLAGRPPFVGETVSDVIAAILEREPLPIPEQTTDVPEALDWIVTKALIKEKEDRYQTAREMLTDLRRLKQRLEVKAQIDRTAPPEEDGLTKAAERASEARRSAEEREARQTAEVELARQTSSAGPLWEGFRRSRLMTAALALVALTVLLFTGIAAYKYHTREQSVARTAQTESMGAMRTVQVTSWSGFDLYPVFSPDGNAIAYTSDRNGAFEIYVRQLTPGGQDIALTNDGSQNFEPAWSPDGQRIAYYSSKRGGIWIVPSRGGTPRQLTDFGSRPAFSPDGSSIVFQSQGGSLDLGVTSTGAVPPSTLWIIPSQGGTPRQITQVGVPVGGHGSPSWSPDGKRIVFLAVSLGGGQGMWTLTPTGDDLKQLDRVDRSLGSAFDPVYSPDGRDIYYSGGTKGGWGVWRLPLSADSREVAADPILIKDTGPVLYKYLKISADGKRLTFSAVVMTNNLWSIPVAPGSGEARGNPAPLTQDTSYRKSYPSFSPDGQKIAYHRLNIGGGLDIWVMDSDGKNATQLTTDPANEVFPVWFPKGDKIAFGSNRNNRQTEWALDLKTGREQLLLDPNQEISYAQLSPDGKQLAFNSSKDGITNIWIADLESRQLRQLTFDKELAGFPCWSPDGQTIAFEIKRGDDTHVVIMPSGGGEQTQLTNDRGQSFTGTWSPDGQKIAFAGSRDGVWNLYWVSLDGKTQKKVTNYNKLYAYVRYPSWSPQGNQIVYEYAEVTGNIWIMELR